jgi:hypothetical protein
VNQPDHTPRATGRFRIVDVSFALLGALALVMKGRFGSGLVHSYGGNVAASFAAFFVLKLPVVPARFEAAAAAALALLAAELFEATSGFGFMSNTYDPVDYLANAIGVALAAAVNTAVQLRSRQRRGPSELPSIPK